jgi:hypothetical protein
MAYEVEQENEMTDSFFDTPAIEVPASPPDAHRAVITSVTTRHLNNDKQTAIISIGLTSRDVPTLETALDIFVPKGYEENIALGSKFDVSALPEVEGDKQQTSFRLGIANSEKTAALQRYVFNTNSIARRAGRDPIELGLNPRPKTLDEYVDNINKMLQGVEVIFLRRERGGDDPAFKHQLSVRDIVSSDEFETNPKRFRKYQLAWNNEG